ncbi:unnamed protein product [Spirodela intermedia]|uniref:Uncharacterized protein n=1 Tax=Spirodela intermedia TaxID=51605 RepID=A0A7I8ITJ0_SPIIN|nr:unnamed protein product [Spirodela intermedia]CAA6661115.1 unnamed protein product [Spirodela intermedia]
MTGMDAEENEVSHAELDLPALPVSIVFHPLQGGAEMALHVCQQCITILELSVHDAGRLTTSVWPHQCMPSRGQFKWRVSSRDTFLNVMGKLCRIQELHPIVLPSGNIMSQCHLLPRCPARGTSCLLDASATTLVHPGLYLSVKLHSVKRSCHLACLGDNFLWELKQLVATLSV